MVMRACSIGPPPAQSVIPHPQPSPSTRLPSSQLSPGSTIPLPHVWASHASPIPSPSASSWRGFATVGQLSFNRSRPETGSRPRSSKLPSPSRSRRNVRLARVEMNVSPAIYELDGRRTGQRQCEPEVRRALGESVEHMKDLPTRDREHAGRLIRWRPDEAVAVEVLTLRLLVGDECHQMIAHGGLNLPGRHGEGQVDLRPTGRIRKVDVHDEIVRVAIAV